MGAWRALRAHKGAAGRRDGEAEEHLLAIRLRLALWYGGLAGLLVLLAGLITYATHTRAHYDDMDLLLRGVAEHIAEEYRAATTPSGHDAVLSAPVAPDIAVRLFDRDGQQVGASANAVPAPADPPAAVHARPPGRPFDLVVRLAPAIVSEDPGRGRYGLTHDGEGQRWRIYLLPEDGSGVTVVTYAALQRIDASVERFRWLVGLLSGAALLASLGGAYLVAGRALRPVATLNDAAQAIARSRNFGERVPAVPSGDELSRLAATFNEMLGSLQQAYEAQQRFVSDASHELRAPLTAIQANLDLLARLPAMSDEERREAVDEAGREAGRLAQLVADLLILARADAGVPLRRQRVELDAVLMEAFSQAHRLAKGQRLEVEHLEPVTLDGDPARLKQVMLILLDNAVKYTPPSGRIMVALRRRGGHAELTVTDTGPGIAAEHMPRVFERFYRAESGRPRDPGGTGLGLSIARTIVEQHQGGITLESGGGEGVTATVRLPLRG